MDKAIIVVGMQKDVVGQYCADIVSKIKKLLERARESGIPVIYACDVHYEDDFIFKKLGIKPCALKGTAGAEVIDELAPKEEDIVVEKRILSAFFATDLDFTLRHRGIKRLILVGVMTEGCVLKTALDAMEIGYDVTVVEDCCSSPNSKGHVVGIELLKQLKIIEITTLENLLPRL